MSFSDADHHSRDGRRELKRIRDAYTEWCITHDKEPSELSHGWLSDLQHVVPGTGSYAFVSDRALFVHKVYLDSLLTRDERGKCCDVSLSLQVSAAFDRAPVVVRANVVDLLEETMGGHPLHHRVGDCSNECLPSWLQINDMSSLPHEHTAILG